jgi:S-formylglutathione hydrolase FrmB
MNECNRPTSRAFSRGAEDFTVGARAAETSGRPPRAARPGAIALVVDGRIDAAGRGYSTYGAKVVQYSLASTLLRRRLDEVGIVPPGDATRPLLVLLHGRHDPRPRSSLTSRKSGPESMLSDALFAGLAQLGKDAPVVVLLNGGQHSWYHDRRAGRWSSMILDEAIPDAIRRFHTRAGRIAIGGISMGGYGALHLAALRPHEFCAVGAHSAALYESFGSSARVAFDDAADFARNNVFNAALRGRFNRLPVWIDGGNRDPFRQTDAAFASILRARGADLTYHVWPGAHSPSYWRAHIAAYLRFYASALAHCSS